jgi:manganese transport protein
VPGWLKWLSWAIAGIIVMLNLKLLADTLMGV